MKYINLDVSKEKDLEQIDKRLTELQEITDSTTIDIKKLQERVKAVAVNLTIDVELSEPSENIEVEEFNNWIADEIPYEWNKEMNTNQILQYILQRFLNM